MTAIEGVNPVTRTLYYHAAAPKPQQRHLYAYDLQEKTKKLETCLTCAVTNCSWAQGLINDDVTRAAVWCKGPAAPHTVVLNLTENAKKEVECECSEKKNLKK